MRVYSPFVAIVLIAWSHAESVQEPSPERLSRLLKLASDYVTTQERSLTNVVAEERYVQEVLPAPEIQHRLSQRAPQHGSLITQNTVTRCSFVVPMVMTFR